MVGGIIGVLVALVALLVLAFVYRRRRKAMSTLGDFENIVLPPPHSPEAQFASDNREWEEQQHVAQMTQIGHTRQSTLTLPVKKKTMPAAMIPGVAEAAVAGQSSETRNRTVSVASATPSVGSDPFWAPSLGRQAIAARANPFMDQNPFDDPRGLAGTLKIGVNGESRLSNFTEE
jgi:hypothetical protein